MLDQLRKQMSTSSYIPLDSLGFSHLAVHSMTASQKITENRPLFLSNLTFQGEKWELSCKKQFV